MAERPNALLEAGVRAACGALVFAPLQTALRLADGVPLDTSSIVFALIWGATNGAIAGPTGFIELQARDRAASLRRDVWVTFVVASLALICAHVARAARIYFFVAIYRSVVLAQKALAGGVFGFTHLGAYSLAEYVEVALPFVVLVPLRLRDVRLPAQMAICMAASSVLAAATMSACDRGDAATITSTVLSSVATGFVLPLVVQLTARLASWSVSRITQAPADPLVRVEGVANRRRRRRWLALTLAEAPFVVVLTHLLFPDPGAFPSLSRAERRIMKDWEAFKAGTLPPAALASLCSRATAIKHFARPRIGENDPLAVELSGVTLAESLSLSYSVLRRV
jgi:hypothetical protein